MYVRIHKTAKILGKPKKPWISPETLTLIDKKWLYFVYIAFIDYMKAFDYTLFAIVQALQLSKFMVTSQTGSL